MDYLKQIVLIAVGVIMIVIQLFTVAAAPIDTAVVVCEAERHEKWSPTKERCVKCRDCPAKKGRNVTDSSFPILKGEHGALNCFPCEYCPTQHFDKANQCHQCNLDKCQQLHRKVLTECSLDSDVECSPICENGYHSDTGNNDRYFPCVANSVTTTALPLTTAWLNVVASVSSVSQIRTDVKKTNLSSPVSSYQSLEGATTPGNDLNGLPIGTLIWITILSVIFIVCICTFIGVTICRRKQRGHSLSSSGTSSEESLPFNFSQDIETDCDYSKDSRTQPKYDIRNAKYVRAELQSHTACLPGSRPELQQAQSTQGPVCCCFNNTPLHQEDKCMYKKEICQCKYMDNCTQCETVSFDETIDDEYLLIVKTNVCHHPEGVFRRLNISCSTVYSCNDDRERDPEKTSQHEYIYKVLKSWTRDQCANAKLNYLMAALCKERFHGINSKLLENYRKRQTHAQSLSQTIQESQANSSLGDASLYLKST